MRGIERDEATTSSLEKDFVQLTLFNYLIE